MEKINTDYCTIIEFEIMAKLFKMSAFCDLVPENIKSQWFSEDCAMIHAQLNIISKDFQ